MRSFFELSMQAYGDVALERSLMARVWHLVHAIASRQSLTYQVAFPGWKDPAKTADGMAFKSAGGFGDTMRIFADDATLAMLHLELGSHTLVQGGLVATSPIRAVPPEISTYVEFIRSRVMDKVTPGFARRQAKRTARRIAEGKASKMHEGPTSPTLVNRARVAKPNYLVLTSIREGAEANVYRLNVERREVSAAGVSASTFGLGGGVPVF